MKYWKQILFTLALVISAISGFFVARAQYTMNQILNSVNHSQITDLDKVDLSGIKLNSNQKIINILVIGNDYRKESGYDASGLPDTILIATLDTVHEKIKLTTLMRDMVVTIPGHGENKLNACYGYSDGGITLLYKTIAQNFNIKLDGYVEVGFEAVETMVNSAGGIEVTLTKSEADYLNNNNYIKKKKYRTVREGKNLLNGAQALGYCRIRHDCYTPTGLTDDFGRTWRQRNALQALLKQMKTKSLSTWVSIAQKVLKNNITTDLSNQQIIFYGKDVMLMGTINIHTLQIPAAPHYTTNHHYKNLGDCLIPDLEANKTILNTFLFE